MVGVEVQVVATGVVATAVVRVAVATAVAMAAVATAVATAVVLAVAAGGFHTHNPEHLRPNHYLRYMFAGGYSWKCKKMTHTSNLHSVPRT